MPLQPGDLLAAKYRIEAEIGRGAFGRVYRPRDMALDRPVAITGFHKRENNGRSARFAGYVCRFKHS